MILHHYPASPFAEKIRAVFGFKQLAWHSVMIPSVMPKPDLMPLTGGYRKTPVLQIGADVYCDTALICDVLEQVAPTPSLYNKAPKGLVRSVARHVAVALLVLAVGGRRAVAQAAVGRHRAAAVAAAAVPVSNV